MNIAARVDSVLREQLGPGLYWNAETRLVEDLKLDSLDIVRTVMMLEDEFRVEIPDDIDHKHLATPGAIVAWLEPELARRSAMFAT